MVKEQKIVGLLLIILGVFVVAYSITSLEIGTIGKPGSGFFTVVCGSGIALMSSIWLIGGLRTKLVGEAVPLWEKGQWLRPLLAVVVIFLYAITMQPLGYIIATALFICLWQIVVERGNLRTIILFVLVGTAAMYLIFEVLLSVPLPNGPLKF